MKHNQAFVRVKLPNGAWVNADILDLTQESFNVFTLTMLCRAGIVTHIKSEALPDEPEIPYEIKPELISQYVEEWKKDNA